MAAYFGGSDTVEPVEYVAEFAPEPVVAAVAPKVPVFSSDGVLMNPEDCVVGADGVVSVKA